MNNFDFAKSIITSSPLGRLTDRAFLPGILFCVLVWITAYFGKTNYDNAIEFTKWVLGPFIIAEKGKDALVAYGALKSNTPDTVNVAGDVNTTAPAKTEAASLQLDAPVGELNEQYAG